MADTLFDLTLATARVLGILRTAIATGGSSTTVVDSNLGTGALDINDDHFNEGSVWVVWDAGDAGAAPEGEFSRVNDFANSTGTLTLDTTLSAAVASGDRYAVATAMYPLDLIIDQINTVLTEIRIPAEDTTSLDSTANQTEYSLPTAVFTNDLRQVYIETNEDSNDNRWRKIYNWTIKTGGTGSADTLITQTQLNSGYDLRLVYVTRHTPVYDATDNINEIISRERVIYRAAAGCIISQMDGTDPSMADKANHFLDLAREAEAKSPIRLPKRDGKLMIVETTESEYTGTVGGVRV